MSTLQVIEIARRMAELGETKEACQAYEMAAKEASAVDDVKMEAALYILQMEGDYRAAYSILADLYRGKSAYQADALQIMAEAFYFPNIKEQQKRYEYNCKLLSKYPYLFRKDFVPFEELNIQFFPFDDNGYLPYHTEDGQLDEYIDFKETVISRNFFKDLEKPILAADVYSQYELNYLHDNVRKSEWVARENHLYLHYTDWGRFCAYLQVLDAKKLLADEKVVFLIGDELEEYPIDFKERFGIDYSQYSVKPVGIREVTRLIWHTQLSTHNGGDFFNEVFDAHPNLLCNTSIWYSEVEETAEGIREDLKVASSLKDAQAIFEHWNNPRLVTELYHMKNPTDKDIFVAMFFALESSPFLDKSSRIAPVLFFQPHFPNIEYSASGYEDNRAMLHSDQYESIKNSKLFKGFPYIKAFTPMRRPTTSCAASVRFMVNGCKALDLRKEDAQEQVVGNMPDYYARNRSFMRDDEDRLLKDSVLVRFEDGKLNPKATFTALAAFLDLPYTESMTYCSALGDREYVQQGNVKGFDPASVYRTYDEYLGFNEKYYVELFLKDAYREYGYDSQYYDGAEMDDEKLQVLVDGFSKLPDLMRESFENLFVQRMRKEKDWEELTEEEKQECKDMADRELEKHLKISVLNGQILLRGISFVNKHGEPLHMMKKLELDPALLEQPLYH